MLNLEIKIDDDICCTKIFKINGIKATYLDFGKKYDTRPENTNVDAFSCLDMRFYPMPPKQVILEKYNINEYEYRHICNILEKELSFGECRKCCNYMIRRRK